MNLFQNCSTISKQHQTQIKLKKWKIKNLEKQMLDFKE